MTRVCVNGHKFLHRSNIYNFNCSNFCDYIFCFATENCCFTFSYPLFAKSTLRSTRKLESVKCIFCLLLAALVRFYLNFTECKICSRWHRQPLLNFQHHKITEAFKVNFMCMDFSVDTVNATFTHFQ